MSIPKTNSDDLLTRRQISEFVRKNFAEIKNNADINTMIHFHSINKFLLMAHDSNHVRILGNLVANHESLPISVILEKYEKYCKILEMERYYLSKIEKKNLYVVIIIIIFTILLIIFTMKLIG